MKTIIERLNNLQEKAFVRKLTGQKKWQVINNGKVVETTTDEYEAKQYVRELNKSVQEIQKPAKEDEVDPKELAMGIEVELEHTDDREEAKKIALQHLAEVPDYYTKLKKHVEEKLTMETINERLNNLQEISWNPSALKKEKIPQDLQNEIKRIQDVIDKKYFLSQSDLDKLVKPLLSKYKDKNWDNIWYWSIQAYYNEVKKRMWKVGLIYFSNSNDAKKAELFLKNLGISVDRDMKVLIFEDENKKKKASILLKKANIKTESVSERLDKLQEGMMKSPNGKLSLGDKVKGDMPGGKGKIVNISKDWIRVRDAKGELHDFDEDDLKKESFQELTTAKQLGAVETRRIVNEYHKAWPDMSPEQLSKKLKTRDAFDISSEEIKRILKL